MKCKRGIRDDVKQVQEFERCEKLPRKTDDLVCTDYIYVLGMNIEQVRYHDTFSWSNHILPQE